MSNPVRQHYIPRSYLKYFATQKSDKYFVDVMMKKDAPKTLTLSTKDICLEKNLYTFPAGTAGDRFALEKHYADKVDSIYPGVYAMLIDAGITAISKEDKYQILNTILSMYFRTPHALNHKMDVWDTGLDKIIAQNRDPEEEVTLGFKDGETLKFQIKDIEQTRENRKQQFREKFLFEHFADWQKFVEYKMTCGISVMEVPCDVPLITSDNPVLIMGQGSQLNNQNVFDPHNIIEVPLDRTHYLIVFPNAVGEDDRLQIRRESRDKRFAAGVNLRTEQNANRMLIGFSGDLQVHLASQQELGAHTEENVKAYNDTVAKAMLAYELMQLVQRHGTHLNQEVADKVKAIRKTHLMDDSAMLATMIEDLARHGFLTL